MLQAFRPLGPRRPCSASTSSQSFMSYNIFSPFRSNVPLGAVGTSCLCSLNFPKQVFQSNHPSASAIISRKLAAGCPTG
ncbi:hypothetical protein CPB84DRAFT_1256308 [Gymnopilus junonius]|uniref:Uncharacterized protein n=1 Tax=Gymnopilus junonius TaxID=109634 RepID=A0A9P5NM70_GYMJU|nr:hypothetical protein CPB84DRAFT_1256308 [Gymnopilus junonius]